MPDYTDYVDKLERNNTYLDIHDTELRNSLGTASTKNVPTSGDATNNEVVLGNDSRLTDSRNAKDVYDWAKQSTKPSYNVTEILNTGTVVSYDVPTSGDATNNEVVLGNDSRLTDARNAKDVYDWAKQENKPTYTATEVGAIDITKKGVANGVAELDDTGKVPSSQLPSFVDDVIEVADYTHLPATGESGKIYVTIDTSKTYRWTGSGYAEISESLALGETSSTAYRGDRGKTAYDHASETKLSTATASGLYKVASTAQGHIASLTAVTKADITGLGIPGSDTNTTYTFENGTNGFKVTPSGGTAQTVTVTPNDNTKVAKAGDTMSGTLRIDTAAAPSYGYGEGLRINKNAANGISTLTIGTDNGTATGINDGGWWIGTSHSSKPRQLFITHNGSTGGGTYFYASSASDHNAKLHLSASGTITSGNTDAVTGGVVYTAIQNALATFGIAENTSF